MQLPFADLIEQAANFDPHEKRLSGQTAQIDELLKPENIRKLEAQHDGAFGFLAFDPNVDHALTAYLSSDSLSVDSGDRLLILFTTSTDDTSPPSTQSSTPWLSVKGARIPAQMFLNATFGAAAPPMPGICFFESFLNTTGHVFVDLSTFVDEASTRRSVRRVLWLADQALRSSEKSGQAFSDALMVGLQKESFEYSTTGPVSLQVWLIKVFQFFKRNSGNLIATAGLAPL